MALYDVMAKLITAENQKLDRGVISQAQYAAWKTKQQGRLNIFLLNDQLTDAEYSALMEMFR